MAIIAFSQLYIWVLALERVPDQLAGFVISLDLGPTNLMLLIALIVLIAGTFIDVTPAIFADTGSAASGAICGRAWGLFWCGPCVGIGRRGLYATGGQLPERLRRHRSDGGSERSL